MIAIGIWAVCTRALLARINWRSRDFNLKVSAETSSW
jgi:hypothetical protein